LFLLTEINDKFTTFFSSIQLKLYEISMISKLNFVEKLPEVYRKQDLWEILCVNLYKIQAFVESAIILQYIEKNSLSNFLFIIEKINILPQIYIEYLIDVFFIEKLVENFFLLGQSADIIERLVIICILYDKLKVFMID